MQTGSNTDKRLERKQETHALRRTVEAEYGLHDGNRDGRTTQFRVMARETGN